MSRLSMIPMSVSGSGTHGPPPWCWTVKDLCTTWVCSLRNMGNSPSGTRPQKAAPHWETHLTGTPLGTPRAIKALHSYRFHKKNGFSLGFSSTWKIHHESISFGSFPREISGFSSSFWQVDPQPIHQHFPRCPGCQLLESSVVVAVGSRK